MRILFYPPFKPLGHPNPSGDLVIATGLYDFLAGQGHEMRIASRLRTRWLYWRPWLWPSVPAEIIRLRNLTRKSTPQLWLTYHSYYKAPDVLGPSVCRRLGLPYVIFQGIYSTKRRRRLKTLPGFLLNTKALRAAQHVFTNRRSDLHNLRRLIPPDRLTYLPPGIRPEEFSFDPAARERLRQEWGVGERPVVLSAAMFRPGVKAEGLAWVIRACGLLLREGLDFHLVIAGDGRERRFLNSLAESELGGRVIFTGQVPRDRMYRYYSAADVFAFPGFRESLGMVYLEAQSCGLPVVACANGGVPEVVEDKVTGFLTPLHSPETYRTALALLLTSPGLRMTMGRAAAARVRREHDLKRNYGRLEHLLEEIAANGGRPDA